MKISNLISMLLERTMKKIFYRFSQQIMPLDWNELYFNFLLLICNWIIKKRMTNCFDEMPYALKSYRNLKGFESPSTFFFLSFLYILKRTKKTHWTSFLNDLSEINSAYTHRSPLRQAWFFFNNTSPYIQSSDSLMDQKR